MIPTDPPLWIARGEPIVTGPRPRVMGIVNITPDSFSDGGRTFDPSAALAQVRGFVEDGVDILDVGGESSRPGAEPVRAEEEIRRILPVIEAIAATFPQVPISVDTVKPAAARAALRAGARIINDIAGLGDPEMLRLAAETDCGIVLMHMAGTPQTMQINPTYENVVEEVRDFLARRVEAAVAIGIGRERIAIDPGIGFGKTHAHNLDLLRNIGRFASLGCTVLVGISRKGILGKLTGRPIEHRVTASVVSSLAAIVQGANVVRVHDVGPMVDAIRVWGEIQGWTGGS